MRFAAIATAAAAAVAIPLGLQAAGPQMSGEQFINAVRCTAYESVLSPREDLGAAKMRLNAEAVRQPADVTQAAHNEVNDIARRAAAVANPADQAMIRAELASACSAAPAYAAGADHSAV